MKSCNISIYLIVLFFAGAITVAVTRACTNPYSGKLSGEVQSIVLDGGSDDSSQTYSAKEAGVEDVGQDSAVDTDTSVSAHLAKGPGRFQLVPTNSEIVAIARIFMSEAMAQNNRDSKAIRDHRALYTVIRNVRNRACNRERITCMGAGGIRYQCITECDHYGETMLSAARRASSRITGGRVLWDTQFDTRRMTTRQMWISTLQDNDERPHAWVECRQGQESDSENSYCSGTWTNLIQRWRAARIRAARYLRRGRIRHSCAAPNRLIAWGGSMDDHIAYSRRLVLVTCSMPVYNRFWRFPNRMERELLRLGQMQYHRGVLIDLRDAGVIEDTGGTQ